MRLIAGLLLICFTYLMAVPMALQVKSVPVGSSQKECRMACCKHKKQTPAPAPTQKGCCGDLNCNPFAQYACCTGFIPSNPQNTPILLSRLLKMEPVTLPAFVLDFCSGCFRPPEMA